jgi:hypothetical protein
MSHAILVKHLKSNGAATPEMLVYDIDCPSAARRLVHTLASSYWLHGIYSDTAHQWFCDSNGIHEIAVGIGEDRGRGERRKDPSSRPRGFC